MPHVFLGRGVAKRRVILLSCLLLSLCCLLLVIALAPPRDSSSLNNRSNGVDRAHFHVQRILRGPPRVGIQIGHERAGDQPEELAALRTSTGGHWAGVDEVDLNRAVARALRPKLEAAGVVVDIIPATVPKRYVADLFVSLHADSSPNSNRRGYKSAHFNPARNWLEPDVKSYVDRAYFGTTGLPDDHDNVTRKMIRYYAFDHHQYLHALHPATPGLIVEMGYLSHPEDLSLLRAAHIPAAALADGIVSYLEARNRLLPD